MDEEMKVAAVNLTRKTDGYYVCIPHGINGGYQEIGPLRLESAIWVLHEQVNAQVAMLKQLMRGAK